MKNANIFVDVDLTLVDSNCQLLPGARESLQNLKNAGTHLFLWSTNGAEYAEKVASIHGLKDLFEGFAAKPDIIIDDMPSTCIAPFTYNVQDQPWPQVAKEIIKRHIG